MEAMNYVKPELIVVAFVLYFFGVALRQAPDADSRMEKSVSSPSAMVKKLQKWCNQKYKKEYSKTRFCVILEDILK